MKDKRQKKPRVCIVLLNWNGIEHLPACLNSLRRLTYDNVEVVMVDNGSTDGSQGYVREVFPEVDILQQEKNIGFAAGNNAGMRRACARGADYIALLNNDMEVDRNWITKLVDAAERDGSIGACATKMLYFSHREIIQGIGICVNRCGIAWDYLNGRYERALPRIDGQVLGACGGAFFVRAEALRRTGLFDPNYFIYLEDLELSMRIWDAGYTIVTVPEARVYHKFAATMVENSRRKNFLTDRNRLRFIAKNFPMRMLPSSLWNLFLWQCTVARNNYWKRDYLMICNQLRSPAAFALQLPGIIAARLARGPVASPSVWRLVRSDPAPPRVRLPQPPLERWRSASESSVRLGGGHRQLGPGWYRMYDEGDRSYRWFAEKAAVSLKLPPGERLTLSLLIGNDYHHLREIPLTLEVEGKEVGVIAPGPGWNRYLLPVPAPATETVVVRLRAHGLHSADITHELTDLSFKVKEIGLVS